MKILFSWNLIIPYFLKYWVRNIGWILKSFSENISESPRFFGVPSRNLFCISDSSISLKLKRDSNDTFSLINHFNTCMVLVFFNRNSKTFLDLEFAFMSELVSCAFISNFPTAISKELIFKWPITHLLTFLSFNLLNIEVVSHGSSKLPELHISS